jgi:hypothetical protein
VWYFSHSVLNYIDGVLISVLVSSMIDLC